MQMFLGPHFRNSEEETKTSVHVEVAERIILWLDQCREVLWAWPRKLGCKSSRIFLNPGTVWFSKISLLGSCSHGLSFFPRSRNLKLLPMVSCLKWGKNKQTPKEWWTFFGPWRNWGNSGKRLQQGKVTVALHFFLSSRSFPFFTIALALAQKFWRKMLDTSNFSPSRVTELVSSISEPLK